MPGMHGLASREREGAGDVILPIDSGKGDDSRAHQPTTSTL